MIKYSSKGKEQQGVQKGAKKEYFDKLKVHDEETDNYVTNAHAHMHNCVPLHVYV